MIVPQRVRKILTQEASDPILKKNETESDFPTSASAYRPHSFYTNNSKSQSVCIKQMQKFFFLNIYICECSKEAKNISIVCVPSILSGLSN